MPRPLRWLSPGTRWFVTNRCFQKRMLLRPDREMNALFGIWLARALKRYPGIRCEGAVQMANHFHLQIVDADGSLSDFMQFWTGNLAKAVNELRGREGSVFARRFSAEPVLDVDAAIGMLRYIVLNPVSAGLVAKHDQWPGVLLWCTKRKPVTQRFRWFDHDGYEKAVKAEDGIAALVDKSFFMQDETVTVHPIAELEEHGIAPREIVAEVRAGEKQIRAARRGKPVLGRKKILEQAPAKKPRFSKRSPRPICHASSLETWKAFKDAYKRFRQAFRDASIQLRRKGWVEVAFPDWSYPPWRPLVRPTAAAP